MSSGDGTVYECKHGTWVETCADCDSEQHAALTARAVAAETALAAAQAQIKELREALARLLKISEHVAGEITVTPGDDLGDQHIAELAASFAAASSTLAAPSDTTALRALLLKVADMTRTHDTTPIAAIVAAVLAKEGM